MTDSNANNGFRDPAFILAITMLFGFLIIIGTLSISNSVQNSDIIKVLGGVFGGWIGTIIGYYFGQRPVKDLTQKVENLINLQERTITKYDETSKMLFATKELADSLKMDLDKATDQLKEMVEEDELDEQEEEKANGKE